jgi:hypothetical protein
MSLFAQEDDDYYDDNHIRYDDYIYSENYKSVVFHKTGLKNSKPIIELGSGGKLTLSFDDLNVEAETYYYSFILCNADWTPADLLPMEYIDGMYEEYFNSNTGSFNTTIRYNHYRVVLPSSNMRITKSGNYILKVYPEGEPDNPIITRRMYVVENRVGVVSDIFMAKSPKYRNTHQEMYVKVNLQNYSMPNIYEDFTMVIQQNGRKDNMLVKHQPKIMTSEYLYFNLSNDILFEAGNEFRVFDIRSLKVQSARVNAIRYDNSGYQVDLLTDESRFNKNYLKYEELNGRYSIIDWDYPMMSDQIEADYAFVNFSYYSDSVLQDGGLYIIGALTDWRIDNSSRLAYDNLTKRYTTSMLLKQGYYNYQYLYVPNGMNTGSVSLTEGSYSETVNEYTIFVYYKDQGQYWDRLIGYQTLNNY